MLFGTDVFGSRRKRPSEYAEAMRASVAYLTEEVVACDEFKRTEYFDRIAADKYGLVAFDPHRLCGLQLGNEEGLLQRIFWENARDILGFS